MLPEALRKEKVLQVSCCVELDIQLLCYKLDIGLAFVKSGLSGTDIPRGRTRLRLVRPLGMSVPDKPLITQAAADIYNLGSYSWQVPGRQNVWPIIKMLHM